MDTTVIIAYLLSVPALLIALTVHEVSHGYAAYKLGDPTAKNLGRLSLNPLKHLDPFGAICMLLFRFGWAKPVPVNTRYFKNPRRDMAITAMAGPLSNFVLGIFGGACYLLLVRLTYFLAGQMPEGSFWVSFCQYSAIFFLIFFRMNIGLGVFNLIPLPPLDGSRVLSLLLPAKFYYRCIQQERYFSIGLLVFLLADSYLFPVLFHTSLLSFAINFVEDKLLQLLLLIPFLRP